MHVYSMHAYYRRLGGIRQTNRLVGGGRTPGWRPEAVCYNEAARRENGGTMRVLMTTDAVGGVWTYGLTLARALAARGVRVALAAVGPAPSAAQVAQAETAGLPLAVFPCRLEWQEGSGPD